MDAVAAFFTRNLVYVYFFYGLAFFAMGLVVFLESGRASEFRFSRALLPLALFGLVHGAHEWFEMFQIFRAAQGGRPPGTAEDLIRVAFLVSSFLLLLWFGARLLPATDRNPAISLWVVAGAAGVWAVLTAVTWLSQRPDLAVALAAADVLARYVLAIPAALLAAWALLRERRDFHLRGMSQYGQALLWAAGAFVVYGLIGQLFVRASVIFPSQFINAETFIRFFGVPIQLLRAFAAAVIAIALAGALRAFEMESRVRLARANKSRIEAQADALQAQQRRTREVEALNAQLEGTTRELAALLATARILGSNLDLRGTVSGALQHVVGSFERACCAVVFLVRPDGGLELAGEYRRPAAPMTEDPPPLTEAVRCAASSGMVFGAGLDGTVLRVDEHGEWERNYRVLSLPLRAKDRVVGALAVASVRAEEPLGSRDLALMHAYAAQIAAAAENSQLIEVVREREAQLGDLVRKLVRAQDDERQRIARELHDETGQRLTALALGMAVLEGQMDAGDAGRARTLLQSLREVSDSALDELRNVMSNLRPAQLDDLGLVPALRWYVGQFAQRNPDMRVTLTADRQPERLSPERETALFRAAQESLSNVARHARADVVTVRLSHQGAIVRLEVIDNGAGFDPAMVRTHAEGSGLGLAGMRERVALVGGRCTIASEPGQGTLVVVEVPVAPEPRPTGGHSEES